MKNNNVRLFLKATAIVLGVCIVIGLVFIFVLDKREKEFEYYGPDVDLGDSAVVDGELYKFDRDKELVLAVGLDSQEQITSEGYRNNQQADFLYLLVIDKDNKSITPIQINRDSMVEYNILGVTGEIVDKTFGQIALSHTYGDGGLTSLCNTKDAVSDLFFGAHIDYYISLTMDAIPIINDELGGVSVYVEDDFTGIDDSIIQGQYCTLYGQSALTFVRARSEMEDSSNLARMTRQREYLTNMYKSFIETSRNDDKFAPRTLEKVSEYLVSSANTGDLQQLIKLAREFELKETVVLKGDAIKGENFMEYYIDDDSKNQIAIDYLLVK